MSKHSGEWTFGDVPEHIMKRKVPFPNRAQRRG